MRNANRLRLLTERKTQMLNPLSVEKLHTLIIKNSDLKSYLTKVKRESDKLDLSDFRDIVKAGGDTYGVVNIYEYWDSFEGELFCYDWEGYDPRILRDTGYDWNKIFNAVGMGRNGENALYNKLFSWLVHLVDISKTDEEIEYWQDWVNFLKELNLIRIEINTVLVRVGLR